MISVFKRTFGYAFERQGIEELNQMQANGISVEKQKGWHKCSVLNDLFVAVQFFAD